MLASSQGNLPRYQPGTFALDRSGGQYGVRLLEPVSRGASIDHCGHDPVEGGMSQILKPAQKEGISLAKTTSESARYVVRKLLAIFDH